MTTPATQSLDAVRSRLKSLLDARQYDDVRDLADEEIARRAAWVDDVIHTAQRAGREPLADEARRVRAIRDEVVELKTYVERCDAASRRQVEELRDRHLAARSASAAWRDEWASMPDASTPARNVAVWNEPRTYHDGNSHELSFIRDAWASRQGDRFAAERVERSQREAEVERRDVTTATFNGLIPPQYLLDKFAPLARARRPFADVVPTTRLPDTGMTLFVTKTVTGTATAVQTTENTPATETNIVTTDITVPVVTILGQQDLSRQSVERGQVSDIVFGDLLADFAAKLDQQWLNGTGSDGESKGIITAATQTQTWTGTTAASFISKVLGAANDVANGIYASPTCIVMHPRRWHWLLAQSDTNGRPLVTPYPSAAQNVQGLGGSAYGVAAGDLVGFPVVVDANIGTGHGASTNEDRVIVTRLDTLTGWDDPTMAFRFDSVAAPESVRLAVFGYSAFTAERYIPATTLIVGTGLVAPSW